MNQSPGTSLKKILVIGSTNTDMVIRTERLPSAGETIIGGDFFIAAGGKGANQAVAAKRLGGSVVFVGKTGKDAFGESAIQLLKDEGIETDFILCDDCSPSGVASITINAEGENSIVVAPGANRTFSKSDLNNIPGLFDNVSILIVQLEIPLDTVFHAIKTASKKGITIIMNPAPAKKLPKDLMSLIDVITPNESEVELLTGIAVLDEASAAKAASELKKQGINTVIITMGSAGAFVLHPKYTGMVTAPKVKAIDSTAAGDTFNGALAVALTEEKSIQEAVSFACKAASISVTRLGAQTSIPCRSEIN